METITTVEAAVQGANRSAISRHTFMSLSHVSRVLSGDRMPSSPKLMQLADELDVTADDLYRYLVRMRAERRKRAARKKTR